MNYYVVLWHTGVPCLDRRLERVRVDSGRP